MQPTALTAIDLDEISVVTDPANPGADILLTKAQITQSMADKDAALAAATAEIAKLRTAERDRALIEKLKGLSHIPALDPVGFIAVYRALDRAGDKDAAALLDRVLAATEAVLTHSKLFGEIGKSGDDPMGAGAYARLMAAGEEIRKAEPDLTRSQAFAKACVQFPDLYLEHARERRAKAA
jgi:hypothetical protein